MPKSSKKKKVQEEQMITGVIDSAREIWLAGLGAFAKAEEEGSKFFESLVEEGEKVESRGIKVAEDAVKEMKFKVAEAKNKANDTWDKIEQVFQDRVARALNSLGVPTYDDIKDLSNRVEALTAKVRELTNKRAQKEGLAEAEKNQE
jgi:poly(hydroxyalkanoate) granule-associated protein